MKRSYSGEFRVKGNQKYAAALANGINPGLKNARLVEALSQYNKAYDSAESDDEKASAAKNVALCSWRITPCLVALGTNVQQIVYFNKQAITHFNKAKLFGERCKDLEWQGKTLQHLTTCFEEAVHHHRDLAYSERIGYSEQYINCLSDEHADFKAECYINLGTLVFHHGITQLYNGFHKVALSCMKECHRPIEEARRLAGENQFIKTEANVLENDCFMHMCTAESVQARVTGDKLLREALLNNEVILMTGVFDAMDWFRQAIILTRETEIEMEAIAHSRLGVIYDKIIKRKDKAHDYFKRCIDLAATLQPKNFGLQEWFQDATNALKRYQDEKVKQEDEVWNKNRLKFVEQLEPELKGLVKADNDNKGDDMKFMKYVYKTHTPKTKSHKLGDEKKKSLKDLLKKALIHYHPDRQKQHGEKWLVLCEEIAKILTRRYECRKC